MSTPDVTGDGLGAPGSKWFSITPGAGDLPIRPRALYVGVTGTLVLEDINGTQVTFVAAAVGYHPLRPVKVLAATTATSIIGIY